MDLLWQKITEWLKEVLISGITGNLSGMFDATNQKVAEISGQIGATPQAWNESIFEMIETLSESVIVPIAGVILAIVMTLELVQLITEKNNLADVDTWMFFKWAFKSAAAVLIVTNTWNIVMGVFDLAQSVVSGASDVVISDTGIDISTVLTDLESKLEEMEIGPLFGLWFQSMFVGICTWALSICIFIVIYGRMIEIYLVTSVAPLPMATMLGKEWGGMGQNYLRSLLALGFQAFLIMVCVAIYAVLVQEHFRNGGHQRGDLDLPGLYGAAVLLPVQNKFPRQGRFSRTIKLKIGKQPMGCLPTGNSGTVLMPRAAPATNHT